jgi:hypothetical protein
VTAAEIHEIVSSLEFRRFHNALRILGDIEITDLENAGLATPTAWRAYFRPYFLHSPYRAFLQAADADAAILWKLIEARQPNELRIGPRDFNED